MDSWTATHTPSPAIKFENSPSESLLSTPGEMYPSLFGAESSPAPIDMMTPESHSEDDEIKMLVGLTNALAEPQTPADRSASVSSATPEPEKKPVKKRKSWGQVLPEPKTNLPPRKRAKTEDEKEQRRVERVLRNRRAAQSSRERKRLEVEGLEKRNKELEVALLKAQQTNSALLEQLKRLNPGGSTRSPSTFDGGLTFSHELFSSHDVQSNTTVDPSAISPTLAPIPEVDNENGDANLVANSNPAPVNASPDSAQHPAVSIGGSFTVAVDGAIATPVASVAAPLSAEPAPLGFDLSNAFSLSASVDADRYVLESGLLSSPNSVSLEYDSVAGDDTSNFPFNQDWPQLDFNDFLNDGDLNVAAHHEQQPQQHSNSCAVADSSHLNPQTQTSSEDSYLQPHPGASFNGCDDGSIAVGVI